jgi:hypothetical protein
MTVIATTTSAIHSLWSKTMPTNTGSPYARPNNAPPYYLGRPASLWIAAHRRRSPQARPGRATAGRNSGRAS